MTIRLKGLAPPEPAAGLRSSQRRAIETRVATDVSASFAGVASRLMRWWNRMSSHVRYVGVAPLSGDCRTTKGPMVLLPLLVVQLLGPWEDP